MLDTKKCYKYSINFGILFLLFIFGVLILLARNPDPFLNPIVYAEDGVWTALGLSKGWLYTIVNARDDYFVFLNVALLFFSTKISSWVSGNPLTFLPESIAFTSLTFFSAVSVAVFALTKNIAPIILRVSLYLLLLLIPLGVSQNEIIGRILQVGFYIPLICGLVLFKRNIFISKYQTYFIDFIIFLCAATNPVTFSLVFVYLIYDYIGNRDVKAWFVRNLTLFIPLGILVLVLLPRMKGTVSGNLVFSNLIEAVVARPLVYPIAFPWYSGLTDNISYLFIAAWSLFIYFCYLNSISSSAKRFIFFLTVTLLITNIATVVMRPGLTEILSNYQTTFPDRYFMGLNALAIVVTVTSIAQISVSKNKFYKIIGYIFFIIILLIYFFNINLIFETYSSKLRLKGQFNFLEQICISKQKKQFPYSEIQIYPILPQWRMLVSANLVQSIDCKYVDLDDDLSNVQDLVVLPTQQLGGNSPIKITMTPSHQNDEAGLKRIGVRFGTNATRNSGDAEISLIAQDGSEFAQKFHLSDLLDNHYYYFDLDSRRYTSGKISSISGGGIATWESSNKKGEVNTCIVYEYTDGRRRFTPGCPPL